MKKMVFLDFDGVLFNTVKEAYAVVCIATKKYKEIKNIDFNTNHYSIFFKYRYLIGPAWNYKYLLELLNGDMDIDIEKEYYKKILEAKKEYYKSFEMIFFKTRNDLKKNFFKEWLKLNESYDFFNEIKIYILNYSNRFKIITTKDKQTVKDLFEINGITFDENSIYDKNDFDKCKNKANIIQSIINEYNIENAIFIDDSKKHLIKCKNIKNLELLQPSWGYVSNNDISTLNQNKIVNKIKKIIG